MKKIIVGGVFLFCGVVLYLGVHIPGALQAMKLGGWATPPGRLGTALNEMGLTAAAKNSIFLIIGGIVLLLWGGIVVDLMKRNSRNKLGDH